MGIADHPAAVPGGDGDGFDARGRPGVGDDGAGLSSVRLRRPDVGDGQGSRGRGGGGGKGMDGADGTRHRAGDGHVGQGDAGRRGDGDGVGIADHPAAVLGCEGDGLGARESPGVGDDCASLPGIRLRRPGVGDGQVGRGRGDGSGEGVGGASSACHRAGDGHAGQGGAIVELVGADVVAEADGTQVAVNVGGQPGDGGAGVNGRRIQQDMVVPPGRIYEKRVAVYRVGASDAIVVVAPEEVMVHSQVGGGWIGYGDAHRVAEDDVVDQVHRDRVSSVDGARFLVVCQCVVRQDDLWGVPATGLGVHSRS